MDVAQNLSTAKKNEIQFLTSMLDMVSKIQSCILSPSHLRVDHFTYRHTCHLSVFVEVIESSIFIG
jgi:hypothetical protein